MRNEILEAFTPGTTVSLSATTSSARVLLTGADGKLKRQVRLYNSGTVVVFVRITNDQGVAVATDMPLAPGVPELVTVQDANGSQRYLAGITASGSATVYATVGEGF
jgi:hypothetical protein